MRLLFAEEIQHFLSILSCFITFVFTYFYVILFFLLKFEETIYVMEHTPKN